MTQEELKRAIEDVVKPLFSEVNENIVQMNRNLLGVNSNLSESEKRLMARINGGFQQIDMAVKALRK